MIEVITGAISIAVVTLLGFLLDRSEKDFVAMFLNGCIVMVSILGFVIISYAVGNMVLWLF